MRCRQQPALLAFLTLSFGGAVLCGGEAGAAGEGGDSEVASNKTLSTFNRERYDGEFSAKCPLLVPRVFENSVPAGRLGNNQTLIK